MHHRFVALVFFALYSASAALVVGARAPLASAIAADSGRSGARLLAHLKAMGSCGVGGIDLSNLTRTAGATDYSYSNAQNTWFVIFGLSFLLSRLANSCTLLVYELQTLSLNQ